MSKTIENNAQNKTNAKIINQKTNENAQTLPSANHLPKPKMIMRISHLKTASKIEMHEDNVNFD